MDERKMLSEEQVTVYVNTEDLVRVRACVHAFVRACICESAIVF